MSVTGSAGERLDDYRWLISPAAEPWLAAAADESLSLTARITRLRRDLSAARAHLVAEQAELRVRGREKFSRADRMYFTRTGLEQATDELIARHKAARFPGRAAVADICAGIGGDLCALAERGPVTAVDRDPRLAILAEANVATHGRQATCEAVDAAGFSVREFAAWHIDPDRRPRGKRTTHVEACEPGPVVLDRVLAEQPNGAIKLAPATVPPVAWSCRGEQEWISRNGECRQQVLWCGQLARRPGGRTATVVSISGVRSLGDSEFRSPPLAPRLGQYLYEPDAAVLAADLTAALAEEFELAAFTANIVYLTGDAPLDDPALAGFVIRDVLPLDARRLRAYFRERGVGRLEIKKRGVNIDPEEMRRRLQPRGEHAATLLLTRLGPKGVAIVADRLTSGLAARRSDDDESGRTRSGS